ncbi:MAG TPA: rhomboid family intramembrane serine protease [Bacteroidetes bacterium]|nr:rhomboid family intramembrane serine protease [Bacteroidota bacterium]
MIPLKDDNPRTAYPIVTISLIVINVLVHLYVLSLPAGYAELFYRSYGAIPAAIVQGEGLSRLFTSMFLHGGIMHLGGNMLYLYIFGDNVENSMGSGRFLLFYLLSGLAAALTHIIFSPMSTIPMIGASGAISGVLGAYALTFPGARVLVVIPIFIFLQTFYIPAVVVLFFWFFMQLGSGLLSLGAGSGGGIAWFAHVGGFVAGMALVKRFVRYPPYRLGAPPPRYFDDDF